MLLAVSLRLVSAAPATPSAPGGAPDPGLGSAPPGSGGLTTILGWVAWVVFALCVAGILIVAGRMAVMHNRGEGGQHMTGLAYVLAACVLAGSASAIVGALI